MWQNLDENLVICPYNRHHIISKLRLQKHLIRCQKKHPDVKLATCFYNYCHKVKPEDLLKHYEICSHKTRMEGSRYFNPVDSSMNGENCGFSFPKITARTQKHFYSPHIFSHDLSKKDFKEENDYGDANSENGDILLKVDKTYDLAESDDDGDEMKPLPLPKTVSKAFTCIKEPLEKCSAETNISETSQSRGFGRAKNILKSVPPRRPKTTYHSLAGVSDKDIILPERKASKFSSKNTKGCDASVVSSLFDDTNTLSSQEIAFDDDDDDDIDNFVLKNFDNYVKI